MRSTLASTHASTRSTIAARAPTGKQQAVVAAAAAPAKATSIDSKKSRSASSLPIRLFSAAAAAMIAVTGPAFADLNSLEAAAGGGKREREG